MNQTNQSVSFVIPPSSSPGYHMGLEGGSAANGQAARTPGYDCRNLIWSVQEIRDDPNRFIIEFIMKLDFLWAYALLPMCILLLHRFYYYRRCLVAAMTLVTSIKCYTAIKFPVMFILLDLGQKTRLVESTVFWLDAFMFVIFFLISHTMRYLLSKFNDQSLGRPGYSSKMLLVENIAKLNGISCWFWMIIHDRDIGSRYLCTLEPWRNMLFILFVVVFCGVYIYQKGVRGLFSSLGDGKVYWRYEWPESTNLPRLGNDEIRSLIETQKKKYALFKDIVVNLEDMNKFFHPHQSYINRFVGTAFSLQFYGRENSMIGQYSHSGEALKLLKHLGIGRLALPAHTKYPRKGVEAFSRPEKLHVIESNKIGSSFYHIVVRSEEFFYFMSQQPKHLGNALSIQHPFVPESMRIPISNALMRFRYCIPNLSDKLDFFPNLRCNRGRVEDQLAMLPGPIRATTPNIGRNLDQPLGIPVPQTQTATNYTDLRTDCCKLFSSYSKNEGINSSLTESHKMELRGEIYRWHNGELHLIVEMKNILETTPISRLLCAVGAGAELLAEGPFTIGLGAESLRAPSQNTVFILQAEKIPLYADMIMELLQPTAALNYSINSSNLPSEMDLDPENLAKPSDFLSSDMEYEQLIRGKMQNDTDRPQTREKGFSMKFLVQAATVEQAYAFGFDMLEYFVKSLSPDSPNAPRLADPAHMSCSLSLNVLSNQEQPLLRLLLQEEELLEDGPLGARQLEDVLTEEVSKLYLSGDEDFMAHLEALVPHLPYRRADLTVLRFV